MNRVERLFDFNAVRDVIRRWPMNRKIQLVQELEQETWADRFDRVVRRMRRQAGPLSQKRIQDIVARARKRLYGTGLRRY